MWLGQVFASGAIVRTEYEYAARPSGWAVVNTQPHREHVALENLKRQDFQAYCPLIKRRHSHARRVKEVLRPLFPGYLFVRINPSVQRWRPLLSTQGVRSLVRCGEELSLLGDDFVHELKAREVDGAITKPVSPYRLGQRVCVTGGAFDGLIATIVEMHERERLTVLMQLLNRAVKIHIDSDQVAAVG